MAERKFTQDPNPNAPKEYPATIGAPRRVSINRGALLELALYGSRDRLEALYWVLLPTILRLKLNPNKDGKARSKPPRSGGNPPNILDIKRWADSLDTEVEACEDDAKFCLEIFATCRSRVSDEFAKEVQEDHAKA